MLCNIQKDVQKICCAKPVTAHAHAHVHSQQLAKVLPTWGLVNWVGVYLHDISTPRGIIYQKMPAACLPCQGKPAWLTQGQRQQPA